MSVKNEKYTIAYSNGALRTIDKMRECYKFKDREETLNFALLLLERLHKDGSVTLKRDYVKGD